MKESIKRIYKSRPARVVKIVALLQVVFMIFTSSGQLPTSMIVSEAHARVPELPTMFIPVFMAVTVAALLYVRANVIKSRA